MACKSRRPASMLSRRGYVTRCFALLDERARGPGHSFTHPRAFAFQPALELPGAGNEKSVKEITAIAIDGVPELSRCNGIVEGYDIAPESTKIESDLLVPTRRDDVAAECAPQYVKCLAQCRSRVLLV